MVIPTPCQAADRRKAKTEVMARAVRLVATSDASVALLVSCRLVVLQVNYVNFASFVSILLFLHGILEYKAGILHS